MGYDYDFIGFTYNGKHSIDDFGIYRTSDGSRYNDDLVPALNDKTADIPGGDGQYFFSSNHKNRLFNIQIAFDHLSETKYREMRTWLDGKEIHDLVFDEAPYKVYSAKVTGTPQLKTLCFEEDGERVYKGEGTIQFTAYYPYAHTPTELQTYTVYNPDSLPTLIKDTEYPCDIYIWPGQCVRNGSQGEVTIKYVSYDGTEKSTELKAFGSSDNKDVLTKDEDKGVYIRAIIPLDDNCDKGGLIQTYRTGDGTYNPINIYGYIPSKETYLNLSGPTTTAVIQREYYPINIYKPAALGIKYDGGMLTSTNIISIQGINLNTGEDFQDIFPNIPNGDIFIKNIRILTANATFSGCEFSIYRISDSTKSPIAKYAYTKDGKFQNLLDFSGKSLSNYFNTENSDQWRDAAFSDVPFYIGGVNNGDLPTPFVIKSKNVAEGTIFHVCGSQITVLEACTDMEWNSKTGLLYGTVGSSKRLIKYSGKSYCTIPTGSHSGEIYMVIPENNMVTIDGKGVEVNYYRYYPVYKKQPCVEAGGAIAGSEQEVVNPLDMPYTLEYDYWYY